MASFNLPYTMQDETRHGQVRVFARKNGKKIRLHAEPGTVAFMREYEDALAKLEAKPKTVGKAETGTLAWLIDQYYASAEFYQLAKGTQAQQESILNRTRRDAGHVPYADVSKAKAVEGRDKRRETPGAANNYLKVHRNLYVWAIERGFADHNPFEGIRKLKLKQGGWHTWTDQERHSYEAAHPIGTTPRLVYELALFCLRRSDICRVGHQHVTGGRIDLEQKKTGKRLRKEITARLKTAIDAMPRQGLHLVHTSYGKPFSEKGIGASFKRWCKQAGLPSHCGLHGLRKAHGAILAEGGASELQIAASLGQTGTDSTKYYTAGANEESLANDAGRIFEEQIAPPKTGGTVADCPTERKV